MDRTYSDLLDMRRPVHTDDVFSRRHPKMPRLNRAKVFAPFSALGGFEEAIRSKEVPYVPRRAPDAEEVRELNLVLNRLCRLTRTGTLARKNGVVARVEYFEVCADRNNDGYGRLGLYRTVTGVVRRVDAAGRLVVMVDRAIPFSDIAGIADPTGRHFGIKINREDGFDGE